MTVQASTRSPEAGARDGRGIELHGLTKTFSAPQGPVRAVRGIDISIERGETVALLGPNGAGKSTTIDMLLGLTRPDAGSVSLFGRPPSEAVDAGAIGAMLQTGTLIRDLSVRELVTMMASLYPTPLRRRRGARARGHRRRRRSAARRSSPAARHSACASRSRS